MKKPKTPEERSKTQKQREIRRLARRIENDEQLDDIVNDAAPNMRLAVRALLVPHLKFTPAALVPVSGNLVIQP